MSYKSLQEIIVGTNSVPYSGIQQTSSANVLIGRGSSGFGNIQELTLGTNLSISGTTLNATGGGGTTFNDTSFNVFNNIDNTKIIKFSLSNLTTGNTRIFIFPDYNATLATLSGIETLTNKTLTSPVISSISNTGTLTLPTSSDTLVGRVTVDTLTNKSISGSNNTITSISLTSAVTGILPVANGGSGIGTLTGVLIGNGTSAFSTVTAPSGTIVGTTDIQTLINKTLTSPIISSISNSGTLTLPTLTDTLVGRATTDTLTNKTIDTATNTITNLVNTNIGASAAITYTKLALVGSIVNSDVSTGAAIAQTKLAQSGLNYITGNYYGSPVFLGGIGTMIVTVNRLYGTWFQCRSTHTFVGIGIRVPIAINLANVRCGIYSDNNGVPGTLVVDGGQVVLSGTGAQDAGVTISQSLIIGNNYWLAFITDSAITVNAGATTNVLRYLGSTTYNDTRDILGGFVSQTYGALPGTFGVFTQSVNPIPDIKLVA